MKNQMSESKLDIGCNLLYVLLGIIRYYPAAGGVHFVDTKGVQTETLKLKRRQVEEMYPLNIEVVV